MTNFLLIAYATRLFNKKASKAELRVLVSDELSKWF